MLTGWVQALAVGRLQWMAVGEWVDDGLWGDRWFVGARCAVSRVDGLVLQTARVQAMEEVVFGWTPVEGACGLVFFFAGDCRALAVCWAGAWQGDVERWAAEWRALRFFRRVRLPAAQESGCTTTREVGWRSCLLRLLHPGSTDGLQLVVVAAGWKRLARIYGRGL